VLLVAAGAVLFAVTLAQLLWALGGDAAYLRALLASRAGSGEDGRYFQWLGRILELHWRYFGLASAAGLLAIAVRAVRRKSAGVDPAQEVGVIFLLAGSGYVGAFVFNATKHDYWQFLLLPASALGLVLLVRSLLAATESRRILRRALLAAVIIDITLVTTVTLVQRHVKREGYCLETVAALRKNHL
jgi:hypothetical protein